MRSKIDNLVKDLIPKRAPHGIPQARYRGGPDGGAVLGAYRGHQAGIYDVYRFLRSRHPRIALEVLHHFGMSKDGSYRMDDAEGHGG